MNFKRKQKKIFKTSKNAKGMKKYLFFVNFSMKKKLSELLN